MDNTLQIIVDFVEGRMNGKEFEQQVYNNPAIEALLADESLTWGNTYVKTNPYYFIIALNYDDPGDLLNAQGAMELFLQRKNVPFKQTSTYSDDYGLLLDAQPRWLHVDSRYIKERILPDAGDRVGEDLKQWLSARLRELFRYYKKPPAWIQSPAWPIGASGQPLFFLGQIKLRDCELFHDEAAVYVFLDTTSGQTETVIQVF